VRYVAARLEANEKQRLHDERINIYITDALKALAENTARAFGGSTLSVRYADLAFPKEPDTRTAGEIIDGLKGKLEKIAPE
jgi:hypothetical protein